MENASKEYSFAKIKAMVERQKEKYGWEFIFLGVNIDAVATAACFGISADRAANYNADGEGTQLSATQLVRFGQADRLQRIGKRKLTKALRGGGKRIKVNNS